MAQEELMTCEMLDMMTMQHVHAIQHVVIATVQYPTRPIATVQYATRRHGKTAYAMRIYKCLRVHVHSDGSL